MERFIGMESFALVVAILFAVISYLEDEMEESTEYADKWFVRNIGIWFFVLNILIGYLYLIK